MPNLYVVIDRGENEIGSFQYLEVGNTRFKFMGINHNIFMGILIFIPLAYIIKLF